MKNIKAMTRAEQLDWVNNLSARLIPSNHHIRAMVVCNTYTEPTTYLHPGDIGDLLDVLAVLLEQELARQPNHS